MPALESSPLVSIWRYTPSGRFLSDETHADCGLVGWVWGEEKRVENFIGGREKVAIQTSSTVQPMPKRTKHLNPFKLEFSGTLLRERSIVPEEVPQLSEHLET